MILDELEAVLRDRLSSPPPGSYTVTLLRDREAAQRKIIEEAFELCLELGRGDIDTRRVAEEAADLFFHALVGLVAAGVPLDAVMAVLQERRR